MALRFVSCFVTLLIYVNLMVPVSKANTLGQFNEFRVVLNRLNALESSVSSLQASVGQQQQQSSGPVAFSAYYSEEAANSTGDIRNGSTYVFDQTVYNNDEAYSTTTGKFRAPSSGTFAFTWTLCADSRIKDGGYGYGEFGSELVVGTSVYGKLQVDTEDLYGDDCSTGFVIVHVEAGEEVYLRNIYAHQGRILSKENQTRTTFSGWLMFGDGAR